MGLYEETIGEADLDRLREVPASLADQFDAIHIVAVRHGGDEVGTMGCNIGTGNRYARVAAIEERLQIMKAKMGREGRETGGD